MTLHDILQIKGSKVFTIPPTARLGEVVRQLVQHNCGSLLVCNDPHESPGMLGIITERDILRACAERQGSIDDLPVTDYMSTEMITGTPQNSVEHIMGVMTDNRIRHLPVMEDNQLVGMISIGDIVKAQYRQTLVENHYLKSYIYG
ncbi:MAG TPA: CBS domain-containing protein [Pirellulales bacterium]